MLDSFAEEVDENGSYERQIFKLMAYAGRYGHQDMGRLRRGSMRDLRMYVDCLGELLEEETAPVRQLTDSD